MADKCRFNQAAPSSDKSPSAAVKKRGRNQDREDDSSDSEEEDEGDGFEALGYMHSHFFANLPVQNEVCRHETKKVSQHVKTEQDANLLRF